MGRMTRVRGDFELPDPAILRQELDAEVEDTTRTMAKQANLNAPVLTGALKRSILASVTKDGEMQWRFGSHLPYAQRQEYEHKTKRAYFRRAIWVNEQPFYAAVRRVVRRRWGF